MILKLNLNHMIYLVKAKGIKYLKKIFLGIAFIIIPFLFTFNLIDTRPVEALTKGNEKLISKITKDYTNKFCNSIAFGLSKDSALKFATKENNLIFKKKKNIESLDEELIANNIANSVIESCGYPLNLFGEEGINEFKNDYILLNKLLVQQNKVDK